jgi:predicted AlkP superfamily pyrophosphatase or phosphodiesterase
MLMRFLLLLLVLSQASMAQLKTNRKIERPKLVVGVVVDQMRWDYLYRYYDRYTPDGGFRRLMNRGFNCENTLINYIPTYTACGHATLYTGSVPAIHGITGNEWWDVKLKQEIYCVQDDSARGTGTTSKAGQMSPRNMLTTTICDELKLATNFRSKVIGVAFKDRGGILPAGHSANAAYWYEAETGNFITSTYYMQKLPEWVTQFNARKLPETYLKKGWSTMYPIHTYVQSTSDVHPAEGKPFGEDQKGFPYRLEQFVGSNFGALTYTPYGNTLTKDMAIAAVNAEQLGRDSITDFLAISFSTPDYIGHAFGPNSIEAEDNYLRLDKELGELLDFLDSKVGKDQYLLFLSADHAAAHATRFMRDNKLPGISVAYGQYQHKVDSVLKAKFGNFRFIEAEQNSQLFFDHHTLDSLKLDEDEVIETALNYLSLQDEILRALPYKELSEQTIPEKLRAVIENGYYPRRCGDIQYLLRPGYLSGSSTGTTHGSAYAYDTHIPLLWYGWKIKPGKTSREIHMTDVAPTLATMLNIQMPNGSVGDVIEELTR